MGFFNFCNVLSNNEHASINNDNMTIHTCKLSLEL